MGVYIWTNEFIPGGLVQIFDFSTSDLHGFTKYATAGDGLVIDTSNQYCYATYKNNNSQYGSIYKSVSYSKVHQRIKGKMAGSGTSSLMCGIGNNYAPSSGFGLSLGCNNSQFFYSYPGRTSYLYANRPSGFDRKQYMFYDIMFDNGDVTYRVLDLNENILWSDTQTSSQTTVPFIGFSGGAYSSGDSIYIKEYRLAYEE